ncbi:hypothetical protein OYE22_10800 [Streptomyces sp. 71268]|uniref:hypothetical protein n=1 Tax=Streptomyces sp. 71268 TaxID=3002640 RepID=UPI0023F6B15E|nr:hypothetical protein [Streptomyces sp. 71268]WEV25629.1 hypothetical protein OYE22_10800 [Streptomyces sp. 71268]
MDWGTLVGTALGATIGVGATLVADRLRWKREETTRKQDVRRQLYGEYLTALTRTRGRLKEVRRADLAVDERARQAAAIFLEGGAYELRYQMALTATAPVVEHSDAALRKLRDVRDRIQEGATDEELQEELHLLIRAIKTLRDAMRTDLEADA